MARMEPRKIVGALGCPCDEALFGFGRLGSTQGSVQLIEMFGIMEMKWKLQYRMGYIGFMRG